MTKHIELTFLNDQQAKAFADACQLFLDQHGTIEGGYDFSTQEIIIHSVIDANRYRVERDRCRQEYAMLMQAYEDACTRARQLELQLNHIRHCQRQNRKSW